MNDDDGSKQTWKTDEAIGDMHTFIKDRSRAAGSASNMTRPPKQQEYSEENLPPKESEQNENDHDPKHWVY